MNDKSFSSSLIFANWFWNLYNFTDQINFWERGITMVKIRNAWIHRTTIRLSFTKFSRKELFQFYISGGYMISFFKHRLYNQSMRRYLYNDGLLHICAAGPLHCTNGSLKKLDFFQFLEKFNLKYLSYNLAFFKKWNFSKYKKLKPYLSVHKGSDLFLNNSFHFSEDKVDDIITAVFSYKDYSNILENFYLKDFNFYFLFDLSVLQKIEIYSIVVMLVLKKNLQK